MWQALWDYKHPDIPCFTAHVKPKPRMLSNKSMKGNHFQFGDVFMGSESFFIPFFSFFISKI